MEGEARRQAKEATRTAEAVELEERIDRKFAVCHEDPATSLGCYMYRDHGQRQECP